MLQRCDLANYDIMRCFGRRVAAFHQMGEPGGSYAEYAVSYDHATFHIPKKTSFEGVLDMQREAESAEQK